MSFINITVNVWRVSKIESSLKNASLIMFYNFLIFSYVPAWNVPRNCDSSLPSVCSIIDVLTSDRGMWSLSPLPCGPKCQRPGASSGNRTRVGKTDVMARLELVTSRDVGTRS